MKSKFCRLFLESCVCVRVCSPTPPKRQRILTRFSRCNMGSILGASSVNLFSKWSPCAKTSLIKNKFPYFDTKFVSTTCAWLHEHLRELFVFKMAANMAAIQKITKFKRKFTYFEAIFVHSRRSTRWTTSWICSFKMDTNMAAMHKMATYKKANCHILT